VTGNYFSESLTVIDCVNPSQRTEISLRPAGLEARPTPLHLEGERWFNDARLCFQGWQSCASCHDEDGRIDGLNWDLLNDGYGNPKNVKSLLWAHLTPPAMSLGVRETVAVAVKAGLQKILFTNAPSQVAEAIEAFIHSLTPVPGPATFHGQHPAAVTRGKAIFERPEVGCAQCHPGPLYTDLHRYDVGTEGRNDKEGEAFDTPALVEVWRTAPYLHDGSTVSLREVLTTRNVGDLHGKTSHLSEAELDDLLEFLLTL
jgi:cytochrome c peroxidase